MANSIYKERAMALRKQGQSIGAIASVLGISKSTVSGWCKDISLTKKQVDKIFNKAKEKSIRALIKYQELARARRQSKIAELTAEGGKDAGDLSARDLYILGLGLYWAEGYKKLLVRKGKEVTHHPVSLTNSDPVLIKMFLRFLREYCKVSEEKIRADLRIFPNQNGKYIQEFWEKETGILPCNFGKIYTGISKSSQSKRPYNRLPIGVIQIRVSDTKLFHRIIGYIEGLKKFV